MGTESRSGNHGHFLFAKQSMTKVHLVQTGVFNGRKGIERTPREVTGRPISLNLRTTKLRRRKYCSFMRSTSSEPRAKASMAASWLRMGGAHHAVLVNLHHCIDQPIGTTGKTDPKAGHGKSFGKPVQQRVRSFIPGSEARLTCFPS